MKDNAAGQRRLLWRVAFIAALAWTAWGSLVPVASLPPLHVWDKAMHALIYAALTGLLLQTQWASRPWIVVCCVVAYGAAIELAQAQTGYRSGDWRDAVANLVGVAFAIALWHVWRRVVSRDR